MKKNIVIALSLIIIGNSIITIAEYFLNTQYDTQQVLKVANQAHISFSIENHPLVVKLIHTKLIIWVMAFSILAIIINLFFEPRKKFLNIVLIGFYILGCSINIFSVPHPIWFKIGIVPLVFVIFKIIEHICLTIKSIYKNQKPYQVKEPIWQIEL